ncbi:hypothetical protein Avbf_03597 [Armadillidium vulgare]|nr:hypothetical protein Avbf_03597 [Armadillidium vulgare]
MGRTCCLAYQHFHNSHMSLFLQNTLSHSNLNSNSYSINTLVNDKTLRKCTFGCLICKKCGKVYLNVNCNIFWNYIYYHIHIFTINTVVNAEGYVGHPHSVVEALHKRLKDEHNRGLNMNVNDSDNSCLPAAVILVHYNFIHNMLFLHYSIPHFYKENEVAMNAERICRATHSSGIAIASCIFTALVSSYLLQSMTYSLSICQMVLDFLFCSSFVKPFLIVKSATASINIGEPLDKTGYYSVADIRNLEYKNNKIVLDIAEYLSKNYVYQVLHQQTTVNKCEHIYNIFIRQVFKRMNNIYFMLLYYSFNINHQTGKD